MRGKAHLERQVNRTPKVMTIFGTRPEVIKLGPVVGELEACEGLRVVNVFSGQHNEMVRPFLELFGFHVQHDLAVMRPNQTPAEVCARVLEALDPVLELERPEIVLVQGDTTTVLAGALAAFYRKIPVGHIEAGLRSGDAWSPFPEEMNRRMVTRLATYHFAATEWNRATLLAEGVADTQILVTGNPVVQALHTLLPRCKASATVQKLLQATAGQKRVLLTTHRRESFGEPMEANLRALRDFVERHDDVALIFPVHLNPQVQGPTREILSGHPRIHLAPPLGYEDFVVVLSNAWLIVSDSGGVQEEAPTLGKPVLVLRANTERPEGIEAGVARLVGGSADSLRRLLEGCYLDGSWAEEVRQVSNPFGQEDSGRKIAVAVEKIVKRGNGRELKPSDATTSIRL
jgi:UDP-N-acetylglucosamine 2-epimerase (non-hydrolysing)